MNNQENNDYLNEVLKDGSSDSEKNKAFFNEVLKSAHSEIEKSKRGEHNREYRDYFYSLCDKYFLEKFKKPHKSAFMTWLSRCLPMDLRITIFAVGDIVTRSGTDEQEILEIDKGYFCMIVKCIKEPGLRYGNTEPWIKIGETEYNLVRRYSLVRRGN